MLKHSIGTVACTTCCFCCLQVKNVEVGTNIVAAYVSGGRAHEVLAVMDALALSASDGFEIAFNQACADVATGKLDAAEQQLLLAQRLGKPQGHECTGGRVGGRKGRRREGGNRENEREGCAASDQDFNMCVERLVQAMDLGGACFD